MRFTFQQLQRATPTLSGPARLRFFYQLPAVLQAEAWAALREHWDYVSSRENEDG